MSKQHKFKNNKKQLNDKKAKRIFLLGRRGHWTVYYSSPKSCIIPNGFLYNFKDWLVHKVECLQKG